MRGIYKDTWWEKSQNHRIDSFQFIQFWRPVSHECPAAANLRDYRDTKDLCWYCLRGSMQSSFSARWSVHVIQSFFYTVCVQPFSVSLFYPSIPLYAPLKSWSSAQISQSLFGQGISSLPAVQYPEQGPNLLLELTSSRPLGSCKSHHRDFVIFLVLFYSENPNA